MRLLADMRRKEEEERNRRSSKKSGGGCCSSVFFFLIAIVVLNHFCGPSDSSDSSDDKDYAAAIERARNELPPSKARMRDYPQSSLQDISSDAPSEGDEEESRPQRMRCDKTNSIHILNLQMSPSNDEGGMNVRMLLKNTSGKVIVKFHCLFAFLDGSGNSLYDEYSGRKIVSCVYEEPLEPGNTYRVDWEDIFSNGAAEHVVLHRITLYFEDGSYLVINHTDAL